MDTRTFLGRVTAGRDEVVISTHRPDAKDPTSRGIFWNRGSFAGLDDAAQAISKWDAEPNTTVYFSVGVFANHATVDSTGKTKWQRRQGQATWFKSLALDLDCGPGKPYATQRDGWAALRAAYELVGLPQPLLVSSGNGLHAYWPLTEPVQAAHWVRASTALRIALSEHGVEIDTSKIHDSSMVLRPVGTNHKKQQPWRPVECKLDCPDYDPLVLFTVLKPWIGKLVPAPVGGARQGRVSLSGTAAAVLGGGDINITFVAPRCKQLAELAATAGATMADGRLVEEPMWRASLGFAKYCTDPQAAVLMLAGGYPGFDLQANMSKLSAWGGTGPTTCAKFEQLNPNGCAGCPYKGTIVSPGQLTADVTAAVPGGDQEVIQMALPPGYLLDDHKIYIEEDKEVATKDANGNNVKSIVRERSLVSAYEIHVLNMFTDHDYTEGAASIAVRYPMGNWQTHNMPLGVMAAAGKEFAEYLINKLIFVNTQGMLVSLRTYLMRYLDMVQAAAPAGAEFTQFGWQPDGSFLCGDTLIGAPDGNTQRRLKGAAARYADVLARGGDRAEWVRAMTLLDQPGAENIAAAVLVGTIGIIGQAAGNSSFLFSITSPKSTTGKTLSLLACNSLSGVPRAQLMGVTDTANAIYRIRGTLNHLPGTIDELTTMDPEHAVDLAYNLSAGREKLALSRDRDVRQPTTWDGPTLVTCNYSLHAKYEDIMSQNDPVKARTLEVTQHDNTFVAAHGNTFHGLISENYGWAMPELVEAVLSMGGPVEVWKRGSVAFDKQFGFAFEPAERFYRTAAVGAWVMGQVGKRLGLFPFDVDRVVTHLLACIKALRAKDASNVVDAFDVIGQFLAEVNDRLIEVREEHDPAGRGVEKIQFPVPERAVARLKVVYDAKNPVLPGSVLAINSKLFRMWLKNSRDTIDRVVDELKASNALISERDRVTLYKGCPRMNPGQTHCVIINVTHPRIAAAITNTRARGPSPVALSVIQSGIN